MAPGGPYRYGSPDARPIPAATHFGSRPNLHPPLPGTSLCRLLRLLPISARTPSKTPLVGRTPWSAADAPVGLLASRRNSIQWETAGPGGPARTRGSGPTMLVQSPVFMPIHAGAPARNTRENTSGGADPLWSAADALVGQLASRRNSIQWATAGPGGPARTRGSAPLCLCSRPFSCQSMPPHRPGTRLSAPHGSSIFHGRLDRGGDLRSSEPSHAAEGKETAN